MPRLSLCQASPAANDGAGGRGARGDATADGVDAPRFRQEHLRISPVPAVVHGAESSDERVGGLEYDGSGRAIFAEGEEHRGPIGVFQCFPR